MSCPSWRASGRNGPSTARASGPTAGMLTADVTTPPVRAAATCSATTTPARSWASSVEAPRCGVTTTPGSPKSGLSVVGSCGKTSMPAPPRWPRGERLHEGVLVDHVAAGGVDQPRARASSPRRPPRPTKPRVSGVEARWRVMKSLTRVEVLGRVGLARRRARGSGPRRRAGRRRSTFMPRPLARSATIWPMRPNPSDAERLAGDLDAAELGALPPALHQAGVRLRDVARLRRAAARWRARRPTGRWSPRRCTRRCRAGWPRRR